MRSAGFAPPETIRADFDRIADTGADAVPDASTPRLAELLDRLPPRLENALDLGCGSGDLARRLAARARHVIAIDLSPRMIALARERSAGVANIAWHTGDFMTADLPPATFDAVATVAALHHLPLAAGLARAASLVRPGGWLLVVDLFQPTGLSGFVHDAISWTLARWKGDHRPPSRAARGAWRAHAAHDRHPGPAEIRAAAATLAGADLAFHWRWRWTLAWRRPVER